MKKILLLILSVSVTSLVIGQVREGALEYGKTQQPAAIVELPYAPDVVEGAIKNHFEKQGAKVNNSKGLMVVKNASMDGAQSNQVMDLYFKVEKKNRQDKNSSIITLSGAHPGENITARVTSDRYGVDEAKEFLTSFTPKVEDYQVVLQIEEQEELLKKADKKYTGLVEDSVDYQKKKVTLEQKIVENSKAQKDQKVLLEKQRQVLEALKARRKP